MNWLFPLLILTTPLNAPIEIQKSEAVQLYKCDFETGTDTNYDDWPDGWRRQTGRGFPLYLKVGIEQSEENCPSGRRCMVVNVDGGSAAVYSPKIPVTPQFSYLMEGYIRIVGLVNNEAFYTVTFYDVNDVAVQVDESPRFKATTEWVKTSIGPILPESKEIRYAVIGVHVHSGDHPDLSGSAMFDDVWFARVPRMSLKTDRVFNILSQDETVSLITDFSGILERHPTIVFEAWDIDGRRLVHIRRSILETAVDEDGNVQIDAKYSEDNSLGVSGTAIWQPSFAENGLYRTRVAIEGKNRILLQKSLSVAVIDSPENLPAGEFGWTLPEDGGPYTLDQLPSMLGRVGINWIKIPVWRRVDDSDKIDEFIRFVERLSSRGIRSVAVLDNPPDEVREMLAESQKFSVASTFVDRDVWRRAIDPVTTRLSLKVRWWQFGGDDDTSFVGFPGLVEKLREVKEHLERFGQEIRLGFGWRWINEAPDKHAPPWDFLAFTTKTPFTEKELGDHLANPSVKQSSPFVTMRTLPHSQYDLETRARDLVTRMVAAKRHKAKAIFIPEPFDLENGLMDEGSPTEMLLAWRTTAKFLSGTSYVGSIEMPNGSNNHIFEKDGNAVMVVWNREPVTETIYLGENIRQVDLWGRTFRPETVTEDDVRRQQIEVKKLPTFIANVNPMLAKFRMSVEFDRTQISSVFGRAQKVNYKFVNPFQQGIGGRVYLKAPDVWDIEGGERSFKASPNDEINYSFQIQLNSGASSGMQPVRMDFSFTADQRYVFSTYRTMEVGLGDIVIELSTGLDDDGNMVVEQHLTNRTDRFVSFNCLMFAPKRRRMRQQVLDLGTGTTVNYFILSNGAELVGEELYLRAEEITGSRILNYK
ncbi:MAG: hypothetical protein ACI9HK_004961, partial [Pirellulaceae bacterium]